MTLNEILKELGDDIIFLKEDIGYNFQKVVERFAIRHFGQMPYLNQLTDEKKTYIDEYGDECQIPIYDDDCDTEALREKRQNIDMDKTLENIVKVYPDAVIFSPSNEKISNCAIFHKDFIYCGGLFYMKTPSIPQLMTDCIVEKKDDAKIRWVLRDLHGSIRTKYMDITPKGEIEGNYNDDFYPVDKKINDIIHSEESAIMILHGKPGTGKTSYIRNLIDENKDVNFYWLDSSMFSFIDSVEFIEYLSSCKNAVFILEDSESLLKSREEGTNNAMQSLLSISDGMLGDSLKLKFICTFNTDIGNIDEAITRKGRLKVRYEFKALAKDKVAEIFKRIGVNPLKAKSMPLCDVYNYLDDNGGNIKERNKIGF